MMNLFEDAMYDGFIVTEDLIIDEEVTDGAENKFFIRYRGAKYLVKDSSINKRRRQLSLAPFCECVGSNFIRLSGLLECQQCWNGFFEERPVVICKDVFPDGFYRTFRDLHESTAGTSLEGKEYTYDDVIHVLEQKEHMSSVDVEDYLHHFWLMFLFDAILGNRDRHEGNWGFYNTSSESRFAPITDNGNSLFPDVDLSDWRQYDFIKERVFRMPGSQFRMWKPEYPDRAMRTNFYEMLVNYSNRFDTELNQIKQLDWRGLIVFNDVIPIEVQLWFKTIIEARFRCLILMEDYDTVFESLKEIW